MGEEGEQNGSCSPQAGCKVTSGLLFNVKEEGYLWLKAFAIVETLFHILPLLLPPQVVFPLSFWFYGHEDASVEAGEAVQ